MNGQQETDSRPKQPSQRSRRRLIFAVLAPAVLVWQVCAARQGTRLLEKNWLPYDVAPTSSPDGSLLIMAGYPAAQCLPAWGAGGLLRRPRNTDIIMLRRTDGGIRETYRARTRTPAIAYFDRRAWFSPDGKVALFTGDPFKLEIIDGSRGQLLASVPIERMLIKGSGSLRDIRRADVYDWQGSKILCAVTFSHSAGPPYLRQYVLVDSSSLSTTAVFADDVSRDGENARLDFRTGRILKDERVIMIRSGKLFAVSPGKKPVRIFPEISHARHLAPGRWYGRLLVQTDNGPGKRKSFYALTGTGNGPAALVTSTPDETWFAVGPNHELIGRAGRRTWMWHSRWMELGAGTWITFGGTRDRLNVWRWDDRLGSVCSEIRDPRKAYAVTSTASYHPVARGNERYPTDWGRFAVLGLWAILPFAILAAAAVPTLRYVPSKIGFGLAAAWTIIALPFMGSSLYFTMRWLWAGASTGSFLVLDMALAVGIVTAWLVCRQKPELVALWNKRVSAPMWALSIVSALTVLGYGHFSGSKLAPGPLHWAPIVVLCMFVGALWEELAFRGLLWQQLKALRIPNAATLAIQAVLFAAGHFFPRPSAEFSYTIGDALTVFAYGVAFGYMRMRSGSLLPGIVSHGLVNAGKFYFSF